MPASSEVVKQIAASLRRHRRARGMTVAALAQAVGVSPRLVSEVERGTRPHVSLDTALRLLQEVGAPVGFAAGDLAADADSARAERAARRRTMWRGSVSTLTAQSLPEAPAAAVDRLIAVASASQLVGELRAAYEQQIDTPVMPRGGGRR